MRQLNQNEVKTVAGAGLLTNALSTTIAASSAVGTGLITGGTILFTPVLTGAVNLLKFII